jgi:hypothetical protein
MDSQGDDRPGGATLQDCCTEYILKVRIDRLSTSSGLLHRIDSQGEDSPCGAPLQDCCTEWILKVRRDQNENLFRTTAQNGFSR